MRRRFFLVFNPTAGTSRAHAVEALVHALEQDCATVERGIALTADDARVDASVAARSGKFDALIACGGDGTVRQVAAAAVGTDCPVGAFMLGTGNVLAHELGLSCKPEAVARSLLKGPTQSVRMGLANGEPFLLMVGCGLDGRIISNLDQGLKQRIAKLAYVPAKLKTLAAPIDNLAVTIDGKTHLGVAWAIVTSASRYGGAFRLTAQTSLKQDGLVAVLFYARRKTDLLRHAFSIARGNLDAVQLQAGSDVVMAACQSVTITSVAGVPVQVDGDAFGTTPVAVVADGPTVKLIVPPRP